MITMVVTVQLATRVDGGTTIVIPIVIGKPISTFSVNPQTLPTLN